MPLGRKIVVSEPLVYFGDGIPTRAVLLDAALLHEEIDEIFLLTTYLAEVMEVVPEVDVEVIFDALDHRTFARVCDVVVRPRIMRLAVGDLHGQFPLLLSLWQRARGKGHGGTLEHLALDRATDEGNGDVAAVAMDEPLAEVGGHFEVDTVVGHSFLGKDKGNSLY